MKALKPKKIKKIITILFVLLILVLSIFIILKNNPVDRRLKYIYNEKKEGNIKIMPINVSPLFTTYNGNIDQRSIYKAMYIFANELVENYHNKVKDFDEQQLKEYYNKKSNVIQKELGIDDEDEFLKFAETLKKINNDKLILESYTINPNTIKRKNNSTEFVLILKYQDNEKIAFYLNILNNSTSNKTPIKYRGGVSQELLDYEYKEPGFDNNPVDDIIKPDGKVIK